MKKEYKKPLAYFLAISLLLALVFFLFPINLFDGQIIVQRGLQEVTIDRPLSLSYFIGMGYDQADMDGVVDFYLTTKGKIMAFIFVLGFPALFAYRIYLRSTKS